MEEVVGLNEYVNVLVGSIPKGFMHLPRESRKKKKKVCIKQDQCKRLVIFLHYLSIVYIASGGYSRGLPPSAKAFFFFTKAHFPFS